jgi:hypothetical protein
VQRPNLSPWRSSIRLVCAPEVSRRPVSPLRVAQHTDQHRPKRPVLLAVDQQLAEGLRLRVSPELADPVGPVEVGEHEDMEQFGARSRPKGVQDSRRHTSRPIRSE